MKKIDVRKINQQKRDLIVDKDLRDKKICEKVLDIINCYHHISLYLPIKNEVSLLSLLELDKNFYIPKVINNERMEMTRYSNKLIKNKFGCEESVDNDYVDAKLLEIILVPLLGFDENLNRVGYGKGYYDRYLRKATKALKIGIAYDCQKVEKIDFDDNDIKLDMIITERNIYRK